MTHLVHASSSSTALCITPAAGRILQRKCACGSSAKAGGKCAGCGEWEQASWSDRTAVARESSGEVPPIVHEVLRSPGRPLDSATRAFMEPRFGHDFSCVRVHTDEKAAESARAVAARAYTVGRNVAFATGMYAPDTLPGRTLLAHELTHVVQTNSLADTGEANDVTFPKPDLEHTSEQEANDIEAALVSAAPFAGLFSPTPPAVLHRKPVTLGTRATHPKGAKRPYKIIVASFNGADFTMKGDGKEILRAAGQSGRPITVRSKDAAACGGLPTDSYLNNPRYVGIQDNGPIPEGDYTFSLTQIVTFSSDEEGKMRLAGEGAYVDPSGLSLHGDWGTARAPLSPAPTTIVAAKHCGDTSRRTGMYLHGGVMPGSSGCIDIGDSAIDNVVQLLQGYRDPVRVTVKYTAIPPTVGPLDRAAGRFMYPPGKNPSIFDRLKSVFGGGEE